ncbi:PucR family transcriptional regulator [Microbacterium tumbae]
MSERRKFDADRTDCPERSGTALLSVADVVALAALQRGRPQVIVGGTTLDAAVRWVHASDSAGVARLLDGGELLLTTGAAWPDDDAALSSFVAELAAAGVAGIVIELGSRFPRVPEAVIVACAAAGLALVALASEVKFVAVTEAVHRALIDAQTAALRERQRLHEVFTALSLRGAPADVIVAETARALGAPVLLENLAHEVVAVEGLRIPVAEVLQQRGDGPSGDAGADRVPVQARGVRWGTLVAMEGPAHTAGRQTVLELGATALAFGCLADGDAEWSLLAQRALVEDLLGARFVRIEDVTARLGRLGFEVAGRVCHGVLVRTPEAVADLIDRARAEGAAVIAARRGGDIVLLLSPASSPLSDRIVRRIAGAGIPAAVGPAADGVVELLSSVRAAIDLARGPFDGDAPLLRRADDRPLGRLVASLRDDRRLHDHSDRMLAPLILHDRERRGDLLDVLGALVAHPGNRSAAAAASHFSRSVFYQRLALIGDLLDADLDDGETLAALHLALLARLRPAKGDD